MPDAVRVIEPVSRTLRAHALDLHVLEWSPPSPRATLLLLHGFQDCAATFDDVATLLADGGLRVLVPDLRGFGDSARVGAGGYYYFPDYVFDVAELVDAISPQDPILLAGHSMGGTVAVMYAGAYPTRVTHLALLEGIGPPAVDEEYAVERTIGWIEGVRRIATRNEKPMTLEEAARRLALSHPHLPEEMLARRARQLSRPVEGGHAWKFDPLHRTRSPFGFSTARFHAFLRRVTARTLFVSGGPAGYHPDDEAERIAVVSARAHELTDAGHMMHWTRPVELARLLLEHFGSG